MTDYSNAAEIETETVEQMELVTIPTRGHKPMVKWVYPEFQCLCPVSQRHDQGVVKLTYQPNQRILESKSVRDYFMRWRNIRTCQEYVTQELADALFRAAERVWLEVEITWAPRGGITARTVACKGEKRD